MGEATTAKPGTIPSILLAAVVLLAGCLTQETPGSEQADPQVPPQPTEPGEGETGGLLSNYTWTAGRFDGNFSVGLSLLPQVKTECEFSVAAMGVSQGTPPTMALFVEGGVEEPTFRVDRGQGSLVFDANAKAEAAGRVERVPARTFPWADSMEDRQSLAPGVPSNVTFAAVGVKWMDEATRPGWAPQELNGTSALLRATCDSPVRVVQAYSGTEAAVFNEASLRGGAGVHAKAAFEESGLAVAGAVGLDVEAPEGMVFLRIGGDLLLNHVGAGIIDISYPGGTDTAVDRPTQVLVEYVVLGNPLGVRPWIVHRSTQGAYSVEATYASAEHMGILEGAIIGLSPVDALAPLAEP